MSNRSPKSQRSQRSQRSKRSKRSKRGQRSLRRHSAPANLINSNSNRTIKSTKGFKGGEFKMVELKDYAREFYKDDVLEYNRFILYILENISIFCNRGLSDFYIRLYMEDYLKQKDDINKKISVWVLININNKLNIDLKDQIKAFAIVENHLVHKQTVKGMLKHIKGKKDNGYNFFEEESGENKALLWANLLAICGVVPKLMPPINVDTTLLKPVQSVWSDYRTWTESGKNKKRRHKNRMIYNKLRKTKKQREKILDINVSGIDPLFKGMGGKLLKQLVDYYKRKDIGGIKYSFLYLEALKKSEHKTPEGLINFYKKGGFKHVAYEKEALIQDFNKSLVTFKVIVDGDFIQIRRKINSGNPSKSSNSVSEDRDNYVYYLPMINLLNTDAEFDFEEKSKIDGFTVESPLDLIEI